MRGPGQGSIRRRASGLWEARASIGGRQRSFYDHSKSAAMAKARQARTDAERGLGDQPDLSTGAWLTYWIDNRTHVRPRTLTTYRSHVNTYLVPCLGSVPLFSLTPGHVQSMLARIVSTGHAETTASRIRATLSVALRAAMLDLGLPRNVAMLAAIPKSSRPGFVPETVRPDQARAILDAFDGHWLWPYVAFSIATGVRQGELQALRRTDFRGDEVTITHAVDYRDGQPVLVRPKSERSQRTLALSALARAALAARREAAEAERMVPGYVESDFVFAGRLGGVVNESTMRVAFITHLERSGLPRIRWHALRRIFAAVLQDQGIPLERIRDLMGHSALRITERYAYTMPDTLRQDMGAIDDGLGYS